MSSGRIQLELVGTGSIQTALGDRRKFRVVTFPTGPRGRDGAVAGTIAWGSVTEKPSTFPPSSHTHLVSDLLQSGAVPGRFLYWNGTAWVDREISFLDDIGDIPSTFPPSSHTHSASAITQSGATSGQILQWNGTEWVPVTFTAGVGGGTGSTDNALLRADGTGGATLQPSGVTLDDSANLAATNWVFGSGVYSGRTYARAGGNGSNVAFILAPTGNGYLAAQIPDGTATGGHNRGNYAVDLQRTRSLATEVASGEYSCVLYGFRNTSAGYASIAGGYLNTVSSSYGVSFGSFNSLTGDGTLVVGNFNIAAGAYGMAVGYAAKTDKYSQIAIAGGMFGSAGEAQRCLMVARATTTNATPTIIGLGGFAADPITVPANSSGRARVTIVARRATAGAETMTWVREVAWQRGVAASTTTIDVQTVGTDRGYTGGAWGAGPAWAAAITADTTNGGFTIQGTGALATNIRWVATIDWAEVTYA